MEAPHYVYQRTIAPEDAPDKATDIEIDFKKGDPVAINGKAMSPATLFTRLNELGHDNGIGRLDLVENRFVGMKSRGVYETPGGTILLGCAPGHGKPHAGPGSRPSEGQLHAALCGADLLRLLVSPEREMLQAMIDKTQEHVEGVVRLKLYKGNVIVGGPQVAEVALFRCAGDLRG